MPLYDTGDRARTEAGENARAEDGEGRRVIVAASDEAIQDYGWGRIWDAAERKYDNGEYSEEAGRPRTVRITTTDCDT
jgi:hypothetical protein